MVHIQLLSGNFFMILTLVKNSREIRHKIQNRALNLSSREIQNNTCTYENDSFRKFIPDLHDSVEEFLQQSDQTKQVIDGLGFTFDLKVLRFQEYMENFRSETIVVASKQTLRDILIFWALSSRHILFLKDAAIGTRDWTCCEWTTD